MQQEEKGWLGDDYKKVKESWRGKDVGMNMGECSAQKHP